MNASAETEFLSPALIKPRDPRIARQLAWCGPGMGHMYSGRLVRGLSIMTACHLPICAGTVALCLYPRSWPFLAICLAISFIIKKWAVWDAIKSARQTRADYRLKDYNRPVAYLMLYLVPNLSVAASVAVVVVTQVGSAIRFTGDFWGLGYHNGDRVFYSKLAYRSEPPVKNDRIVFRHIPTGKPINPGLILAVAGESITTDSGTTVVPPDQVWLRSQDNTGKNHDRLVSSYAIGGKVVFRYWPFSRIGAL